MASWGPLDDLVNKKKDEFLGSIDFKGISNTLEGAWNGYKGYNRNIADLLEGKQSYSDLVKNANSGSDGWYSTIANGLPIVKDFHNALLGRDSAKDYLENNGLGWEDMEGYNDAKLLGRSSSGISGLSSTGMSWINNIGSDLGKLYSQQKS